MQMEVVSDDDAHRAHLSKRSAQHSSPRGRELRGRAGERPCSYSPPLFEHRDFVCEDASV